MFLSSNANCHVRYFRDPCMHSEAWHSVKRGWCHWALFLFDFLKGFVNLVGLISRESITSLPRDLFTNFVVTHLASVQARDGMCVLGGKRE